MFIKNTFLITSCFVLGCSIAQASPQEIIGTWKGVSNVTVVGGESDHFDTEHDSGASFIKADFTLIIDKVEGQNFAGIVQSISHEEPVVGTFRANMKTGYMADYDGTYDFEMLAPDRMEACYVHPITFTDKHTVAACIVWVKQ
jgi:hypothetical protein